MLNVGGYWMNFATARQLASTLGIDLGDDTKQNNLRMEFPINNWLADNGKLNCKAGVLQWPQDGGEWGLIFLSQFRYADWTKPCNLVEDEKDIEVKKWLEGLGAS